MCYAASCACKRSCERSEHERYVFVLYCHDGSAIVPFAVPHTPSHSLRYLAADCCTTILPQRQLPLGCYTLSYHIFDIVVYMCKLQAYGRLLFDKYTAEEEAERHREKRKLEEGLKLLDR